MQLNHKTKKQGTNKSWVPFY